MTARKAQFFDFIVNRRGGTVLKQSEDTVRAEILSRFGDRAGTFTYVTGDEIAKAVRDWAKKNANTNRCLVIGGGDGTVRSAVEQVLGRDDIMLGILPLGTQNFVARQLGFSADFKKAAAQYKSGRPAGLDVGEVNGMHFLVGITIDRNSIHYFEAREDARDKKGLSALRKAFAAAAGVMGGKKDRFTVQSEKAAAKDLHVEGRVVAITSNSIEPQPVRNLPYNNATYRDALTRVMGKRKRAGKLSLYVFKGGLFGAAGVVPSVFKGEWDKSKFINKESARQFVIRSENKKEKRAIILDGEIKKVQYPLTVKIIPRGVKMFRPR